LEAYESFTRNILRNGRGKSTGAFFDFDGTIIATHSVKDMFIERLRSGEVSGQEIFDLGAMLPKYLFKTDSFEDAMAASIKNLEGIREEKLIELGQQVSHKRLAAAVYPEVKAMIRAHQRQGHTLAIVSSATRYQIEPLASSLGIEHVLCTELQTKNGRFTGEFSGKACYGDGKVDAVRQFARKRRISLNKSFFYSDGAEDIALLETVGHPVVINPDSTLAAAAKHNGWSRYELDSRGFVGAGDLARTLLTFGSAVPFLLAGLPIRVLGGTQQEATNFSLSTWASMASAVARLKLIVEGEEHLWSQRPAVFLFNHQSAIDILIGAKLMRQDVVGIAKKEIQQQPFVGPALAYAGAVFIDREHVGDPAAALQPAVDALNEGRSVVIAPEGTRSRDGKLGKFKKGAFHLARAAGVPIVPIVIHNAADALPNHAFVVRPAEVKVTVLKPIPTKNWTLRDVSPQSRRVRNLYLKTLGQTDQHAAAAH
jgi:putative phosphoserine phosphatase/1-acylglycerol-3-phosphate O-acyltransferase